MRYVCYCGSMACPESQCRFYETRAQYEADTAEFWANWDEAQRRIDEEMKLGK